MPVTTLKLPAQLKARIGPLARLSGKSPHAWMLDALHKEAELSEAREQFITEALEAAQGIDEGEPVFSMEDVHAFVRARAKGERTRRPKALRASKRR